MLKKILSQRGEVDVDGAVAERADSLNVHKARFAKAQTPRAQDCGTDTEDTQQVEYDEAGQYDSAGEDTDDNRFSVENSSDSIQLAKQRLSKQKLEGHKPNDPAQKTSRLGQVIATGDESSKTNAILAGTRKNQSRGFVFRPY